MVYLAWDDSTLRLWLWTSATGMDTNRLVGSTHRGLLHLRQCAQQRTRINAFLCSRLLSARLPDRTSPGRESERRIACHDHLLAFSAQHYLPTSGITRQRRYVLDATLILSPCCRQQPTVLHRVCGHLLRHCNTL